MLKRKFRPRRNRAPIAIISILIVFFILWLLFMKVSYSTIRPVVSTVGISKVNTMTVKIINDAISKEMTKDNIDYGNLINLEKDGAGNVTALTTNLVKANHFKANVTNAIIEGLSIDEKNIKIPLGNFFGNAMFSGRGPKITFKLIPTETVITDFENAFVSSGINQTRHQIMIRVNARIGILMPLSKPVSTTVNTSICVAETIIVGKVPDTFTNFDDGNSTEDEQIKNYFYNKTE